MLMLGKRHHLKANTTLPRLPFDFKWWSWIDVQPSCACAGRVPPSLLVPIFAFIFSVFPQELATEGKLDNTEWPTVYQKRYPKSWWYHLKLCFTKKLMLLLRDKAYLQSQVIGAVVMGKPVSVGLELTSVLAYICMHAVHPGNKRVPTAKISGSCWPTCRFAANTRYFVR